MEVNNSYEGTLKQLRTQLFSLRYKLALSQKNLTNEKFTAAKEEISRVKKEMGKVIYLSRLNENEIKGEMKK
ncbi:MAG: hypothetical protein PHS98_04370 [Bacilli bacterium]|nr:hypothetical protein [Bacilli bacterium]